MTVGNNTNDLRDAVLLAFHQACENPTTDQISEWARCYPQFAEDIRAHAAIAREWASRKDVPVAEPDEVMLARGYDRFLNALSQAEVAAKAQAVHSPPSGAKGED